MFHNNNCCCVRARRRCRSRLELRHENDKNLALASVRAEPGKMSYFLSFVVRAVFDPSAFVPSPGPCDFPFQKCALADANHDSRLAIRRPSLGLCIGVQILIFCKEYGTKLAICCIMMVSFTHFWLQNMIVGCDLAGSPGWFFVFQV